MTKKRKSCTKPYRLAHQSRRPIQLAQMDDPAPVAGPSKLPPLRHSERMKKTEVVSQVWFQINKCPTDSCVDLNFQPKKVGKRKHNKSMVDDSESGPTERPSRPTTHSSLKESDGRKRKAKEDASRGNPPKHIKTKTTGVSKC